MRFRDGCWNGDNEEARTFQVGRRRAQSQFAGDQEIVADLAGPIKTGRKFRHSMVRNVEPNNMVVLVGQMSGQWEPDVPQANDRNAFGLQSVPVPAFDFWMLQGCELGVSGQVI